MGEPPPMAIIQSGSNSRMASAPFMTVSMDGSDSTPSNGLTSKPPSLRSVSYTHLDVYKRQALDQALNRRRYTALFEIALGSDAALHERVIADVYKRQMRAMAAESSLFLAWRPAVKYVDTLSSRLSTGSASNS